MTYVGGGGNDAYTFDLTVDAGLVQILDDSPKGFDYLNVANYAGGDTMTTDFRPRSIE